MNWLSSPNLIDIVALVVVVLGAFQGWLRGLSGELARLISVVVAFVLGIYFYRPFGAWFLENTRLSIQAADTLAFVVTVLAAAVVMVLLRVVLKRIMKVVIEEKFDKACGVAAGLLRAWVLVAVVFLAMNLWPNTYLNRKFGEESIIGRQVLRLVPELRGAVEEDGVRDGG